MRPKTKIIVAIIVAIIIVLAGYFAWYTIARKPFVLSYNSKRAPLLGPILVTIDNKDLIASAICFAPLTNDGRGYYVPVFFSTEGAKLPEHLIEKYAPESLSISSFGRDISEVSINIASQYWERIELVVIVSNYEEALQVAPLAAWLNAPIILKGPGVKGFLEKRNVGSAIVVGAGDYNVGVKRLNSREDIWNFYLERLKENGATCDYIIVTNPKDAEKDLMVPYLSVNSAVLGAFRKAVVVTGDYSVDKELLFKLGYGCGDAGSGERGGDEDTLNDTEEMSIQKVINEKAIKIDNEIDYAVEFLKARGFNAEYLALVGAIDAVPMLYIKNPIWYEDANEGNNGEEYLASDSYYGDLDLKLDSKRNEVGDYICHGTPGNYEGNNYDYKNEPLYTQELAVGRIVAWNLLDASALIARSLDYKETPSEASIITSRVCGTSSEPLNPDSPPREQQRVFLRNRILAKVWRPYETSTTHGLTDYLGEIFSPAMMARANFIIYDGHGFPDGWYYWWVHMHEQEESLDTIRTEDVRKLALKPSVVFSASCLCSALDWPVIWNGSADERRYEDLGMEMFFSLALIHAGTLAHIGSTEESWGMFFAGSLVGYGDFDLATWYFEDLLDKDLTLGKAHSSAKQRFIVEYKYDTFMQTCFLENVLYGEPAVNP
ncbi:MAG: C25 family cysteine peptidase [Candidatus Thermoplasmatota archaeon]